jgi:hypothetical protein
MSQPPSGQDPYGPPGGQPPGQGGWGPPPGPGGWGQPQGGQPGQQPGQPGPYGPPGQPGPYGQQPGQAGPYGAPGQQGPYGQPGQQGPYGPPGQYGAPGPFGPPGQPPGPQGPKRGLVIGLVAGLVALIAIGAVLFVTLGGDDDTSTATSTSSSGATTSSSAPSSTSPPTTPSSSASTAPSGPVADFLAILPVDFTDCEEAPLAGDGDIAHAVCGASTTQPGPQQAGFWLYPDQATLSSVFESDVAGAPAIPEGQTCNDTVGVTDWTTPTNSGRVACTIDADSGNVAIVWTDDNAGIQGIVTAPGTTQADLGALAEWWAVNSDFQL